MVLLDRVGDGDARERFHQVDLAALVGDGGDPERLARNLAEKLLDARHQVMVVAVRAIELQHREFGIVARRNAFVAEIAVDLEHLFESADHQPLQIELGRDAQVELHVERVVMGDERPRGRAARNRMHHRRFDFEVALREEKIAHRLDDARALDEAQARVLVRDQVEIALAVALLLVGQAVELFRQRAQRLGEHHDVLDAYRQFVGLGLERARLRCPGYRRYRNA